MRKFQLIVLLTVAVMLVAGCSNKKLIAEKDQQIADLEGEVMELKGQVAEEKERAERFNADLKEALADLEQKERLWLEEKEGLTKITLPEAMTFTSGSVKLTQEAKDILDKIWSVLAKYPEYWILIEGHTDNVQILEKYKNKYKSNWELSSARAHSVLHYLREKYEADPERLKAVGYGEYQSIATNETDDGKAKNRRVVIAVRDKR